MPSTDAVTYNQQLGYFPLILRLFLFCFVLSFPAARRMKTNDKNKESLSLPGRSYLINICRPLSFSRSFFFFIVDTRKDTSISQEVLCINWLPPYNKYRDRERESLCLCLREAYGYIYGRNDRGLKALDASAAAASIFPPFLLAGGDIGRG